MAKLSKNRCRYSFCPYFFYRNSNSTSLIERLRTKESKPEAPFSEKHFGRCGIFPEILLLLCATKTPIIMSFIDERVQPTGLTFDDVLLVPAYSEVLPREVNVTRPAFREISNSTFRSSRPQWIRSPKRLWRSRWLAKGASGSSTRTCPSPSRPRRCAVVKRAENGMIYDPITISKEHTVGDALDADAGEQDRRHPRRSTPSSV